MQATMTHGSLDEIGTIVVDSAKETEK